MKPARLDRPTLASFLAAYGPLKGARLWAFLVSLSLVGREQLQQMGIHRTAITKNLLELTTHPALRGMKLTGHHVRGRTPRELLEDFVADLVEATYQGHIAYKDFRELAEALRRQADSLEEALRRRGEQGLIAIALEAPRPARGPRKKPVKRAAAAREESVSLPEASLPAPVPASPPVRKAAKKKEVARYLSSGYCELCTPMWPDDWKPTLTGRGWFRCLGCKQELDIGLRMEPTRATMRPVPRPASYRREDLEKLKSS